MVLFSAVRQQTMKKFVSGLWICFLIFPDLVYPQDLLFPYGVENGDSIMPKIDDGFEQVSLDFEFPFFDRNHRKLFLSTNGVISFLKEVIQYTPDAFPLSDDRRLIAPFWADVDSSVAGDIFYREDRSLPIIELVDSNIQRAFPVDFSRFSASWVFLATWEEVAFYNNRPGQKLPINNTFQAVLASDGLHSFTIFNYEKIEWTTGLSSFGDKDTGSANSENSVAAQVGFNAGDGITYFAVEGSRTQSVKNVTLMSNVGIPGRWVFRIDNAEIESAGCRDISEAEIKISPSEVSMLGGDILAISGPCFDSSQEILCRVDGILTQARHNLVVDPFTIQCATPVFMRLGRVLIELSLDGGVTFKNNVTVSIVPLDYQTDLVTVIEENELSTRISWQDGNSPFDLAKNTITNVDVLLYGYREDVRRNSVELIPVKYLKRNIKLSNKNEVVDASQLQERDFDVAIIRLTETGKVDLNDDVYSWTTAAKVKRSSGSLRQPDPIPALWSLPFNTNPDSVTSAERWCRSWTKDAERVTLTPFDPIVDCPCRLDQALNDVGRFQVYPKCEGSRPNNGEDCLYRPRAQLCVRAKYGSQNLGRGQLCCYGNSGQLLDLRDTTSGGSVQSRHHFGFEPNYQIGNIPYFSNFLHDIIPWEECCGKTGRLNICKLYSDRRPPNDCKTYIPPGLGSIFGEPHLQTWDNESFTFNGYGEYQLVELRTQTENMFKLQGRMEEVVLGSGATGLTAVVAEADMSDRVQVELNQRRDIDVWVYHKDEDKWTLPDFTTSNYYIANGVAVEIYGTESEDQIRSGALVTFSEGSSYEVRLPESGQSLNLLVNLSPYLKGAVWGLLGTWDGDITNEFTLPDGSSANDDISLALHNHLQEWRIAERNSLFHYTTGRSAATYRQASDSFVPNYDIETGNATEAEISDICGTSTVCRFDFLKTMDADQGRNAKSAEEGEKQRRTDLLPVVGCGYIPPPENGFKEGEIYLVKHTVTFLCDTDFVLRGSSRRTCEEQGMWSGNVTICIPREEQLDDEDELMFFVIIGVAATLVLSLLVFCLLLFCCVVSRKKNVREKEKILKSAYQLEASVISNDLSMRDEENSYNNQSSAPSGPVTPGNGHVSQGNGHLPHRNGHVPHGNGHVPHGNGHVTSGQSSPPETVQYASQMSFAEHQTENVSQAHVRNQDVPEERHGSVQRMPSINRPSTSRSHHRGDDGLPALSGRPKSPLKGNDYGSLPVRNVNYDSHPEGGKLSPKFQNLSNMDESDEHPEEDEVTRIKRMMKEDPGRL